MRLFRVCEIVVIRTTVRLGLLPRASEASVALAVSTRRGISPGGVPCGFAHGRGREGCLRGRRSVEWLGTLT